VSRTHGTTPIDGLGVHRTSRCRLRDRRRKCTHHGSSPWLHKYTVPTPGTVLNFLEAGTTFPSGPGQLMLSGQNVVQPGDSLPIYIDASTKKTQRYDVRVQNFNYQRNGM
jgi:hypothetical protein